MTEDQISIQHKLQIFLGIDGSSLIENVCTNKKPPMIILCVESF